MSHSVASPLASRMRLGPFPAALALVAGLTALRLSVLFATPLELYPDEAQYWVWSRHLAFGYFSKPPMIAWLIRVTTALGGDGEPWVRLAAPILHGLAALALQRAGRRLYDGWVGFGAALIYSLMPGVQLSSGVISTDAPLLLFISLALWAYAAHFTASDPAERLRSAGALGTALGLAALAKYAAFYFLIGLAAHALCDRQARRRWSALELTAALGAALAILTPNLIWNAGHGFATLAHTVADAAWSHPAGRTATTSASGFDPRQGPGFLLSQLGVFGPIPFALLIARAVILRVRRPANDPETLLLCLALPPLAIVLLQAVVSRANANWAAVAYCPAAVLCSAWLTRPRAWGLLRLTIATQAFIAAGFMAAAVWPSLADRTGFSNSLKRARGWAASTGVVEAAARRARASGPLSAIAVDDRFLFNAFSYYGRTYFAEPDAPPLRMWMHGTRPRNEAERAFPLRADPGGRVLFVNGAPAYRRQALADFAATEPGHVVRIVLDPRHGREMLLFVGHGFRARR